jgi:bile acid-coenzyme A ligase
VSYSELNARSNRAARALLARGVKAGDLVGVLLPNGVGIVEACFAAWKIGATPMPLPSRLTPAELQAILAVAGSPTLISDARHAPERSWLDISALAQEGHDAVDFEDRVSAVSRAITSGGSTGRPKVILGGAPALYAEHSPVGPLWGMREQGVSVMPAPLYHTSGFAMMVEAVCVGARLILSERFDTRKTLQQVSSAGADWLFLVPTMMGRIWRLPEDERAAFDVSTVRTLWHLAAPCPAWLKEAYIGWFGADVVMERYGGAEAQAIAEISGGEWLARRGSVGRVRTGEMKAFDPDGAECPPHVTGEIYLRRPRGAPPTYRYLGAAARTLPDGWESLGDMGWFDDDGYLFLCDRRADMILVGGSNVYPAEVEAAIEEHPLVASCAVIGLPDEDLGAVPHAIVEALGPLGADELNEHLAARLAPGKRPRTYEFTDRPLRDDAGKVRRSALRSERIQGPSS